MTYKKNHLIIPTEFVLDNSLDIFEKFKNRFSEKEINFVNFGHYGEDHSLRIRVDFNDENVEKRASEVLGELSKDKNTPNFKLGKWQDKSSVKKNIKTACTLSSKCASLLNNIAEFDNIRESNTLPDSFSICFYHKLFSDLGIAILFNEQPINRLLVNGNLFSIVNRSVESVLSTCKAYKSQLSSYPEFLKVFLHMLCNDILIPMPTERRDFWQPFCRLFGINVVTEPNKLLATRRFCEQLNK